MCRARSFDVARANGGVTIRDRCADGDLYPKSARRARFRDASVRARDVEGDSDGADDADVDDRGVISHDVSRRARGTFL